MSGITKRMPFTTTFKKWDIILVSFPFTDFSSDKRRPALVVSPDEFNDGHDLVIAFITSQTSVRPRLGDYHFSEWIEAGLPKPSMLRMKFASVDKSIVVKKIGQLSRADRAGARTSLLGFFSL